MKIFIGQTILAVFLLGCTVTPIWGADSATDAEQSLDHEFCRKCHVKEIEDIETEGMAHKTEIDCVDCHAGHKPKSFENIPRCSLCHSDAPHYNQLQCLNCHQNPHRPLEIKLPKKAHAECLTCHESQGEELKQFPSYHSTLVCTDCHHEHGELPECMSCHQSHDPTMAEDTCQACHGPHKPLDIAYTDDIPTSFCSPCHGKSAQLLENSQSKHGQLSCATCHINRHGTIPACEECHGKPHAPGIHNKFLSCGECHATAHQLD